MAFNINFGIPLEIAVKRIGKLKFGKRWNDSDFDNFFTARRELDYDSKYRVICSCSKVQSLLQNETIKSRTTTEDGMSVIELSGQCVKDVRFELNFQKSGYRFHDEVWEPIAIVNDSINAYITSVTKKKPRNERTFAWRNIVLMAVQFVHRSSKLPSQSMIVNYIQELSSDDQSNYPHEKDLYKLADDLLKIFDKSKHGELSFKITSQKVS